MEAMNGFVRLPVIVGRKQNLTTVGGPDWIDVGHLALEREARETPSCEFPDPDVRVVITDIEREPQAVR